MRILAFVDTHGSKAAINRILKKARAVDVLLCAGDLTYWGDDAEGIIKKFKSLKKPFLMIHGNHESPEGLKEACDKFDFAFFLHKASYRLENYLFLGYGGGGFASENPDIEKLAKKFKKTIKKDDNVVLFTHGPPYGTRLDFLEFAGHRGCNSIRRVIDELKPKIYVCGHLHENFSVVDRINGTMLINPGSDGKILRI